MIRIHNKNVPKGVKNVRDGYKKGKKKRVIQENLVTTNKGIEKSQKENGERNET